MKAKVCFCPSSIVWIAKHLKKSARATFRRMIKTGSISSKEIKKKITRRVAKHRRHFSTKQLAAQRLFAKRSRLGDLQRRRKSLALRRRGL